MIRKWLVALVTLVALVGPGATVAGASKEVVSTFGSGCSADPCGSGEFQGVGAVAVNTTTGDVYVQDVGDNRVQRFAADGTFISTFGGPGGGDGEFAFNGSASQIAVDQSDGSVYVADTGNNRIQKFSAGGVFQFKIGTADGSAAAGDGEFNGPSGVAVDPTTQDLFVADTFNARVQRFSSAGAFETQIGGPGSGFGQFSSPSRVAVDGASRLYVVDQSNARPVQRFDGASGDFQTAFAQGTIVFPDQIATDPANDHVFLSAYTPDITSHPIFELDSAGNEVDRHAANGALSPSGLALSAGSVRIYAGDGFNNRVLMLEDGVVLPEASIDPVDEIAARSATFNGRVDPHGSETLYHFEFSTDGTSWRCAPSTDCQASSNDVSVGSGSGEVAVSQTVMDTPGQVSIEPNTLYHVRLVAIKPFGAGTAISPETTFTTAAEAPSVTTHAASGVTATEAQIGGSVNAHDSPTTWYVEYGVDTSYGTSVPAGQDADVGSGGTAVPVTQQVTGLQPGTTYHFRVVAHNQAGTTTGVDRTLITASAGPPPLPESRVYEKITPDDKNGGDALPGLVLANDRVSVTSTSAFVPGDPFFKNLGRYLASRSHTGWALRPSYLAANTNVADVNRAGTQEVIEQDCELCPSLVAEDTDDVQDIYVRGAQGLSLVSQGSQGGNSSDPTYYAGQSTDGTHILFETAGHLESADSARSAGLQLYERAGGQTRVLGILPDGTVDPNGAVLGNGTQDPQTPAGASNAVSADGSTVFFESPDPALGVGHQLYARLAGTDTIQVSASQCDPACDGDVQPATFQGASEDGERVYFTTAGRLVNDDSNDAIDLYQYRRDTSEVTLVTQDCTDAEGASVDYCGWPEGLNPQNGTGIATVSADGRRVYFGAPPAPAGDFGGPVVSSLWLYDEVAAATRFVAPVNQSFAPRLFSAGLAGAKFRARTAVSMTPDGSVLLFESDLKLTSFDNVTARSCRQVEADGTVTPITCVELYRYQAQTGQIDCISCNPEGAPPIAHAVANEGLFQSGDSLSLVAAGQHPSRLITDDGRTAVFSTGDALTATDTNGKVDVYLWRDGDLSLLTTGKASADAQIAGVTPDGRDVFFTTYDRLVSRDVDFQADLYDARVEGDPAFGARNVAQGCQGDQCQIPLPPAPVPAQPGSSTFTGAGNAKSPKAKARPKKCKRGRIHRRVRGKVRCVKKPKHVKKRQRVHDRR
jgi:hypothetical protein